MKTNQTSMRPIYKYIFMLFSVSFVFSIKISKKDGILKKVTKILLFLFNVYVTLLYAFSMVANPFVIVASIIMTVSMIIYRWLLCARLDNFKSIAVSLSELNPKRPSLPHWFYVWAFMSTLTQIFLLAYNIANKTYSKRSVSFPGFNIVEPYATTIKLLYVSHTIISFLTAVNTFSIFYVAACLQIRSSILNLAMRIIRNQECGDLSKVYSRMKSMVDSIDDSTCFLMLCSSTYTSASVYYFVSMLLHPEQVPSVDYRVLTSVHFMVNLLTLVAMSAAASMVSEASQRVGAVVRMHPESLGSAVVFQRFVALTEKDICLTLWKIVPIRRQFIIGTLGGVLTYTVLFDSLTTH